MTHLDTLKQAKQVIAMLGAPNPLNFSKEEILAWQKCNADLDQAIATEESSATQEPVTILPDGSAFGVMTLPLPSDHWIYAPNEYKDGEYEPIDLPKPILTHAWRSAVVAAVRYAVRGATMQGKEMDFDPDALVQNAVYALCGPFISAQPKAEQEPKHPCIWTQSEDPHMPDTWESDCGAVWTFTEGGPKDNDMKFCPNCGKPTIEAAHGIKE